MLMLTVFEKRVACMPSFPPRSKFSFENKVTCVSKLVWSSNFASKFICIGKLDNADDVYTAWPGKEMKCIQEEIK